MDGAFLVRVGERVPNSFAITFIAEKKIKHCLVKQARYLFDRHTKKLDLLVK
jgi:hypothetical protein